MQLCGYVIVCTCNCVLMHAHMPVTLAFGSNMLGMDTPLSILTAGMWPSGRVCDRNAYSVVSMNSQWNLREVVTRLISFRLPATQKERLLAYTTGTWKHPVNVLITSDHLSFLNDSFQPAFPNT